MVAPSAIPARKAPTAHGMTAPLPSPGNLVGQLALGFPLWFGYKSRVERGDGASARRAPIAAASSSGYGANKAEANPSMWAKRLSAQMA